MTPSELKSEIERVFLTQPEVDLAPLLARLRATESRAAFDALFPFAAHSERHGPAAGAAWLLAHLNPTCPITCREAIQEMLCDWCVSIEEVPFYLARQFGVATVRATVADLRATNTEEAQVTLDSIAYWLQCYEEMRERQRRHGTDS
jgi:hypothetical protein